MKNERLIKIGDGVLDQIKNIVPYNAKFTVFMPYEVGDYSIFLREPLEDVKHLAIFNETHDQFISKEILNTPEGSIVYFDQKLQGIFAGYIYNGWTAKSYSYSYQDFERLALEMLKANHISLTDYLSITRRGIK